MINNITTFFKTRKRGFTLVETLGAVLLLSISLVGPMVIAQKGLQASLIAKDQNTAFNLAQDAIEYIRFARDTNCLVASAAGSTPCPAANWLNGNGVTTQTVNLGPCVTSAGTAACYFDSVNGNVDGSFKTPPTVCAGLTCVSPATPSLNYDSGNNNYTYITGVGITPTIFTRAVVIKYPGPGCTNPCNAAEADITVTVSWSDPIAHSVVVSESIYDWQ